MEMNLPWREILIGVVSIAAFYLLQRLVGLLRRRNTGESRFEVAGKLLASGADDLDTVLHTLAELQQRVNQIEARMQEIPATSAKPEVSAYPDQPVYATATLLARDGLSAEELSERCGISFSEAELIVALNRQKGTSSQNTRQLS